MKPGDFDRLVAIFQDELYTEGGRSDTHNRVMEWMHERPGDGGLPQEESDDKKLNISGGVAEQDWNEFLSQHLLDVKVTERDKSSAAYCGSNFYATIEYAESMEGGMLRGVTGNGDTVNDAVKDLARNIEKRRLAIPRIRTIAPRDSSAIETDRCWLYRRRAMTPREKAEDIADCVYRLNREELVALICTAIEDVGVDAFFRGRVSTLALLKGRTFERRKMVRDIVTTRDGEHSTKRTVMIEVEIAWPEEQPLSVHETAGEWRLL